MIKTKPYEHYKLQWLIDHGYTLKDLMDELETYKNTCEEFAPSSIPELFKEWEQEIGFKGEIYACEDEFMKNEYLNPPYTK